MPTLPNPQHESFAQARFAGKSLTEAHYEAGFAGDKSSAFKLSQLFEIRERLAELYREAASQTLYEKTQAIKDLLGVIHACPSDAGEHHPLCEARLGKNGTYYRFPSKLSAMSRLIKLMRWDHLPEPPVQPNRLKDVLHRERARHRRPPSHSPQPPVPDPDPESLFADSSQTIANHANNANHANHANSPLPPRQEAFANARVKGLGLMEAYQTAGYSGDSANLAWRLDHMPAIQARIATLNGAVEAATAYRKDDAVRDLVAIVHANPAQAGPDHPLCEERLTSWGSYHRFPSKLGAIMLLAKMHGWADPARVIKPDPFAHLKTDDDVLRVALGFPPVNSI